MGKPGYIWYVGIREDKRGAGLGVVLYNHIRRFVEERGCGALTHEIEIEDEIRGRIGEEAANNAARRRRWYKALGAKAIGGIHYRYERGNIWEVMVHPFNEISPQDALDLVMGTIDGKYMLLGPITLF
jgi:ribosomal protein S18 acetylase RimI-like enzyme